MTERDWDAETKAERETTELYEITRRGVHLLTVRAEDIYEAEKIARRNGIGGTVTISKKTEVNL